MNSNLMIVLSFQIDKLGTSKLFPDKSDRTALYNSSLPYYDGRTFLYFSSRLYSENIRDLSQYRFLPYLLNDLLYNTFYRHEL